MNDVARRAGVSLKTVSNVINGYPYIREATRERVESAIAELDYQVNVSARNLRSGKTGMIGLAVPELSLAYFAELADLVMQEADRRGLTVLIEQTGASREREIAALTSPRRGMTDGLIFSPLALSQEDSALLDVDFPLVVLGERIFGGPADHVTMQNVQAAKAATEHLISLGRRRIAVIGVHPGEEVGSAGLRLRGHLEALSEAGIAPDPTLLGVSDLWHRAQGAEAMTRMLDAGIVPDGVFGLNDTLALGAMHVLLTRGFSVPDDVAVVGFDDIDDAQYSLPPLTTIRPGQLEIARLAVELLDEQIGAKDPRRAAVEREAAFELVIRESTAGRR